MDELLLKLYKSRAAYVNLKVLELLLSSLHCVRFQRCDFQLIDWITLDAIHDESELWTIRQWFHCDDDGIDSPHEITSY